MLSRAAKSLQGCRRRQRNSKRLLAQLASISRLPYASIVTVAVYKLGTIVGNRRLRQAWIFCSIASNMTTCFAETLIIRGPRVRCIAVRRSLQTQLVIRKQECLQEDCYSSSKARTNYQSSFKRCRSNSSSRNKSRGKNKKRALSRRFHVAHLFPRMMTRLVWKSIELRIRGMMRSQWH